MGQAPSAVRPALTGVVQLAETCGNGEKPEVITHAEVTRSCDSDEGATVPAVDDLARRGIAPEELLSDTNYGSTGNAIECEERGVELVSPVPGPKVEEAPPGPAGGEARAIPKDEFDVDPKGGRKTRCPAGREAKSEKLDRGTGKVRAVFGADTCAACPLAARCPAKRLRDGTRSLGTTVHAAVLARRRRYERTEESRERYAERAGQLAPGSAGARHDAGIEATNSEMKRAHGLGRLRIRGLLRVRLAVHLEALACPKGPLLRRFGPAGNVKRMVRYLVERGRKAEAASAAASCVIPHFLGRCRAAAA